MEEIGIVLPEKYDLAVSETRSNSLQPVGHYDPLDLDIEDLFVKYKKLQSSWSFCRCRKTTSRMNRRIGIFGKHLKHY